MADRVAQLGMETTTTKTCKQLYDANPVFREMVDVWVEHRWCPAEMQDVLLEEGLEHAADCAKWCYETEEREGQIDKGPGRVYPYWVAWKSHWWVRECQDYFPHNKVPPKNLPSVNDEMWKHSNHREAILALLDAWRIAQ